MNTSDKDPCGQSEVTCAYAAQALAASEVAAAQAHIAACPHCQRELASLRPVVDRFASWPADVLRPTTSLQARLALRIAGETGKPPVPPPAPRWAEPDWEQVAPGIECKLLATDAERHRVSMLVRLAPGAQLSRAYACRRRRAASSCRRTVDRRAQALPRRLQLRCPRSRRRARLERDGLHLRAHHQHQGCPALNGRGA